MKRTVCTAAACLVVVVALAGSSVAQTYAGGPPQEIRQGLAIGFGLGVGDIDCSDCEGTSVDAFGADFHLGVMMNPQLALGGEIWVMGHSEDTEPPLPPGTLSLYHTLITGTATYWLLPRLWIKGGLGIAYGSVEFESDLISVDAQSEAGFGILAGAGYEVLTTRRFALDAQVQFGVGFYNEDDGDGAQGNVRNLAFGVGFTWF